MFHLYPVAAAIDYLHTSPWCVFNDFKGSSKGVELIIHTPKTEYGALQFI